MGNDQSQDGGGKRKSGCLGCLGRLLLIALWLLVGFCGGWVANEGEKQGWDMRGTWEATRSRVALLIDQLSSLMPEAGPQKPQEPQQPEAPPPLKPETPTEQTDAPAPKPEPKPETEVDRLVRQGDAAFEEGRTLFARGKSVASAAESNRCYIQAAAKFQAALDLYEKAGKLNPKSQRVQRKISKAAEQLYWCKKLQRL